MPAQAPTQALRLSVTASAATSAGMTSAAQARSPVRKRMRAAAVQAMSINCPEYVMYMPERALRPLPEVVRLQDAELHEADGGADRAGCDDDVDDGERAPSRQQPVRDRDDRKEQRAACSR